MSSQPRPLLRHAATGSTRSSRASSAGGLRRLPLMTVLFLAVVLLAWNLSFYQELYLDHASAAVRRDPPGSDPAGTIVVRDLDAVRGDLSPSAARAPADPGADPSEGGTEIVLVAPEAERVDPGSEGSAVDAPELPAGARGADEVVLYPGTQQVRAQGRRVDGKREGEWAEFYPDGEELSRGAFLGDLRHGPWVEYYRTGQEKHKGAYREGLREGPWRSWHETGSLMREGTFRDGRRVENWTQFYTDGSIMESGRYVDGLREGFWSFYAPDGTSDERTGWYEAGRRKNR